MQAPAVKRLILAFALLISASFFLTPTPAYANAAAGPSIVITVQNPPEDLEVILKNGEGYSIFEQRAWLGYCGFYPSGEHNHTYIFEVTTGGESFTTTLSIPVDSEGHEVGSYNQFYILDLATKQLVLEDENSMRSIIAIVLRILLTLLIEGIVFWLFGFRKISSWIAFIAINLITQTCLSFFLSDVTPYTSYPLFYLFIGEFFVFIAEFIAFPLIVLFTREIPGNKHWTYILLYVFVANLASLVLGGFILTYLPM